MITAPHDLRTIWRLFTSGNPLVRNVPFSFLLSTISDLSVSDSLDAEMCAAFTKSPTRGGALFLGLCGSTTSITLLEGSLTNKNADVVEAIQMALARRGDKAYEELFIRRYVSHPIATNITPSVAMDPSADRVIASLSYIGSVDCIAALLDSAPAKEYVRNGLHLSTVSVFTMRKFLTEAGIAIPAPEASNDEKMIRWWRDNRQRIVLELRKRDRRTLPPLGYCGISTTCN